MSKILLEIVMPDKLLLSKEVDEVICPGAEGDFGAPSTPSSGHRLRRINDSHRTPLAFC